MKITLILPAFQEINQILFALWFGKLKKKKNSNRNAVGILLTKLRTGHSSSILKTLFNISWQVCKPHSETYKGSSYATFRAKMHRF